MTDEARQLRAQIEEAFADVPYPGDDHLYDGWQRDDDCDSVIAHFQRKHWKDVIPNARSAEGETNPLRHDLTFCSAAAWHFFLPAYLMTELAMDEVDPFPFRPPEQTRNPGYVEERFRRLSAAQRRAVASVLAYGAAQLARKQESEPGLSHYYRRRVAELQATADYWKER